MIQKVILNSIVNKNNIDSNNNFSNDNNNKIYD